MTLSLNTRLIKFVKILLDLLTGLFVIGSVFIILLMLASPLLVNNTNIHLTASTPVTVGTGEPPQFSVEVPGSTARGIRSAIVDGAQGTLRLETANPTIILMSYSAALVTAIGYAYLFYLLRDVLQALLVGVVFSVENSGRIRRIGYLVFLISLMRAAAHYFASEAILKQLPNMDPPLNLPSPFDAEIILASMLILILAHVWSYGLELERDRALTI